MTQFTSEMSAKLTAYLENHILPNGLGSKESACSIAAINLAISGKLTDSIPPCMSNVIGRWIIRTQDSMPAEMRNSVEWKSLLPLAAGTGRSLERQRAAVAMEWMWAAVLPTCQKRADNRGYGAEWRAMCKLRTPEAARVARKAAAAYDYAYADASAADAAADASYADAYAAAAAAAYAAAAAADANLMIWQHIDPCAVLRAMIAVKP